MVKENMPLPYEGEKPFLFISYAHKNGDEALEIIRKLQEQRVRLWYDEGIPGATKWPSEIAGHIRKCHCLVVLLSQEYQESDNCINELIRAANLHKPLLIIRLSEFRLLDEIEMQLGSWQQIFKYEYAKPSEFYAALYRSQKIKDCIVRTIKVPVNGSYFNKESDLEPEDDTSFFPDREDVHETDQTILANLYRIKTKQESFVVHYHELLGPHSVPYIEGNNLHIHFVDWSPDLRPLCKDFDKKRKEELDAARQKGYTIHPAKLCLDHYIQGKDEPYLDLYFGSSGYIEHRVFRTELDDNDDLRGKFFQEVCQSRGNSSLLIRRPWANADGGVWMITKDGYLILSFRRNLGEVPERISYSSSGSYDHHKHDRDGEDPAALRTPAESMRREMVQELGIPEAAISLKVAEANQLWCRYGALSDPNVILVGLPLYI